eukprot:GHVS01025177.1.p1 GENE.GHVS01025177.1~~GHVS01025177.1.p1  ORF type:complete len:567 (-),score=82.84 GHVS01025177.1:251-1924(-)
MATPKKIQSHPSVEKISSKSRSTSGQTVAAPAGDRSTLANKRLEGLVVTSKGVSYTAGGGKAKNSPSSVVQTSVCMEEVEAERKQSPDKPDVRRSQATRKAKVTKKKTVANVEITPTPPIRQLPQSADMVKAVDVISYTTTGSTASPPAPTASPSTASPSASRTPTSEEKSQTAEGEAAETAMSTVAGTSTVQVAVDVASCTDAEATMSLTNCANAKPITRSSTASSSMRSSSSSLITPIPTIGVNCVAEGPMRSKPTGSADAVTICSTGVAASGQARKVMEGGTAGGGTASRPTTSTVALPDGGTWPSLLEGAEQKVKRKPPPPTGASPLAHLFTANSSSGPVNGHVDGCDVAVWEKVVDGLNCMREQLDQLMERSGGRRVVNRAELDRLRRQISLNEETARRLSSGLRHGPVCRADGGITTGCWRALRKPKQRQQKSKAPVHRTSPVDESAAAEDAAGGGQTRGGCGSEAALFRLADGSCSNMFVPGCELAGEMAGGASVGVTAQGTVTALSLAIDQTATGRDKEGKDCKGETYCFYDSSERAWIQVMLPQFQEV